MNEKIDHTGYQLPNPDLHNFLANQGAKALVEFLNNLDINKDGKSDVAEIAPIVFGVLPEIAFLVKFVDPAKLSASLKALPIFAEGKNEEAEVAIEKLVAKILTAVEEFTPKS